MSQKQQQDMIDRNRKQPSLARPCTLLDISRAWLYHQPITPRAEDLKLMHAYSHVIPGLQEEAACWRRIGCDG